MDAKDTKLARLREMMARGDEIDALRMAARFPRLGEHKERITRAWAAHTNPDTYRAMGHDPSALVADGIAAIRERYGMTGDTTDADA